MKREEKREREKKTDVKSVQYIFWNAKRDVCDHGITLKMRDASNFE